MPAQPKKGWKKVDQYVDVNLGVFGLLQPKLFGGAAIGDKAASAISLVLEHFSFPVLNVLFSASGRLREKDRNDLKVETRLDEMEVRIKVVPLKKDDGPIDLDRSQPSNALEVLGVFPFESEVAEPEHPRFQVTPNVSSLLSAIPADAVLGPLTGIISGLGLAVAPLFRPKFRILEKAFVADINEFGWYRQSHEKVQQEGPHYGAAFLQVKREVRKLSVTASLATDWKGGDVDNQLDEITTVIEVKHPEPPKTPLLSDLRSPATIPLVVPREDVKKLLSVDDGELDELIKGGRLDAFGANKKQITKGSLLKLLGL